MDIVNELTEECYVLSATGVIAKAINDKTDLPADELFAIARYCSESLYKNAVGFCNPNQVPAIVFMYSEHGEFQPIDNYSEEGEVM